MYISIKSNESMLDAMEDVGKRITSRDETSSPSDVMTIGFDQESERSTVTSSGAKPIKLDEECQQQQGDVPFFIMEYLEQVDPEAMELAQRILQTSPHGKAKRESRAYTIPPLLDLLSPRQKHQVIRSPRSHAASSDLKPISKHLSEGFQQRSITVGNGYNAKGILKARQGRWVEALACWEDALEIRTQIASSDGDHTSQNESPNQLLLDVANTRNNIGIALGKLNRIEEAVESLQAALAIRQQEYGCSAGAAATGRRGHPEIAATLHNLGNVYQQAGDFSDAIFYFGECRRYQELWHGTVSHVEVARACLAMGHTYHQAGAYQDAQAAYHDALEIFAQVGLSEEDPEVGATWDDIHDLEVELQQQHGHHHQGQEAFWLEE